MKEGQKRWTRDELILTFNLYCRTPFGKLHSRNPEVIELAALIGRSPNAIAFKLVNFASLDPSLKKRGIKGASNHSKLDKQVWDAFNDNWEELAFESEQLRAQLYGEDQSSNDLVQEPGGTEGKEELRLVKARVNQRFFRSMIMAAYDQKCCITGIGLPSLLIAGHIRPWAQAPKLRLNPHNGLALNTLHDKAFELGLITITPDYKVKVSSQIPQQMGTAEADTFFNQYEGRPIRLPQRFLPDPELLKYHNDERFLH